MPTHYATLLCGGVLIAAALICAGFYLLRRARRPADERAPRDGSDGESCGERVLWDVTGRASKLVVRDGVLYIDRRSALVRGFRSVLALVGIAAVGRSAEAVSVLLQGDEKKRTADDSGGHPTVPAKHTDIPARGDTQGLDDDGGSHTDVYTPIMPDGTTPPWGQHIDIRNQDEW